MHIKKVEEILNKSLKDLNQAELAEAVLNEEFIAYLTNTPDATKDVTNYVLNNNKDPEVIKSFKVIKYQLDILDVEDLFNSSEDPEKLSEEKIQNGTALERIYASLLLNDVKYTDVLKAAANEITNIIEEIFDIYNFALVSSFLDILYTAQTEWHRKTEQDILVDCVDRLIAIQEEFSKVLEERMQAIAETYPSDVVAEDLLDPTVVKEEEDSNGL